MQRLWNTKQHSQTGKSHNIHFQGSSKISLKAMEDSLWKRNYLKKGFYPLKKQQPIWASLPGLFTIRSALKQRKNFR